MTTVLTIWLDEGYCKVFANRSLQLPPHIGMRHSESTCRPGALAQGVEWPSLETMVPF